MNTITSSSNEIQLNNRTGLTWVFSENTENGFGLGTCQFKNKPLETPLNEGLFFLRNIQTKEIIWLTGARVELTAKETAQFWGEKSIEGVIFSYSVVITLSKNLPASKIQYQFSVDKPLTGWEIGFTLHQEYSYSWTGHFYPFAADAKAIVEQPLTYVGVPSVLQIRDDHSLGMLYGFDLDFDCLNPTTWTGDCGYFFTDGVIPAQFRVGSQGLEPGIDYVWPLQIILSDKANLVKMIPDLVETWIKLNKFSPEELFVRSEDDALHLFIEGRRNTSLWNPGIGYKLEEGDPESNFVYLGEQPLSAYFEYLLYKNTEEPVWRQRCFEQMDFMLKGQDTDPESINFGVIHTAYDLGTQTFDSDDRGSNIGFKPDLNAYMARYMLMTWQAVKDNEGLDRQDWYQAAIRAADWTMRQRNADGGLPQVVHYPFVYMENDDDETDKYFHKSISSTPGRALAALPIIYKISGEKRYEAFTEELEAFVRRDVEGRLRFTGHHPDLPPDEIEEASIWGIIEYWLDKYEQTKDKGALERAIANAYLSILWWCPKQLSWVQNPTQCASAEQQHFLQYSIYCYQNRKLECLQRLFIITNNPLLSALYNRVLQGIFWTQIDHGDLKGAAHERIADPWLARHDYEETADFNSLGTVYMGEQILDTMLQIFEMKNHD